MASGIVNIVLRSAAESSGFAETLASARRLSGENAGNGRQRDWRHSRRHDRQHPQRRRVGGCGGRRCLVIANLSSISIHARAWRATAENC